MCIDAIVQIQVNALFHDSWNPELPFKGFAQKSVQPKFFHVMNARTPEIVLDFLSQSCQIVVDICEKKVINSLPDSETVV